MLFTHVRLRVRPDRSKEYEETFAKVRKITLDKEPGCHLFELSRDASEPNTYHVLEAYRDAEAVNFHTSTKYYLESAEIFVRCLEGDHVAEIERRGLKGREMYSLVEGIEFERHETI